MQMRVYTLEDIKNPGDYCGPITEYTDGIPAVFFLPPIVTGIEWQDSLHHVQSPPHKFYEESDGTLTIMDSIGCGPQNAYYYLIQGNWQLTPKRKKS